MRYNSEEFLKLSVKIDKMDISFNELYISGYTFENSIKLSEKKFNLLFVLCIISLMNRIIKNYNILDPLELCE